VLRVFTQKNFKFMIIFCNGVSTYFAALSLILGSILPQHSEHLARR